MQKITKAPLKVKLTEEELAEAEIQQMEELPSQKEDIDHFSRFLLKNSKYFFPLLMGGLGVFLIGLELVPLAKQIIAEKYIQNDDNVIVALADPEVKGIENIVISNPDNDYFKHLSEEIEKKNQIEKADTSYEGTFTMSIPKLGADNIQISANVDSFDPAIYKTKLASTLAHFKGTALPYQNGNTVIYGHSASGLRPGYKETVYIFSRLDELTVGDLISIEIEGETYSYSVSQKQIVEPEDLSVIESRNSSKNLTLITCYPNGHNAKRLVLTANEIAR